MLRDALTVSALITVVLLVRAIFKTHVPKRMIYALWLVVLLKLCLPGTAISLPVLPSEEEPITPVQQVETETPVQAAPAAQQPAQTVTLPQTPMQQPAQATITQPQETAKPTAAPLLLTAPMILIWFGGSVLLGAVAAYYVAGLYRPAAS